MSEVLGGEAVLTGGDAIRRQRRFYLPQVASTGRPFGVWIPIELSAGPRSLSGFYIELTPGPGGEGACGADGEDLTRGTAERLKWRFKRASIAATQATRG